MTWSGLHTTRPVLHFRGLFRAWLALAIFWGGCGAPDATQEERLRGHVSVLASEGFAGRATGRVGERLAARYLADAFRAIGLEPLEGRDFFQHFAFTSGVRLGGGNALDAGALGRLTLDQDWRPLAFSEVGDFGPLPVVFGGYGFAAPATAEVAAVDSYGEVDVSGRWLLVLRDWPEGASDAERQHWGRYAGLRYKAILARERGAAGLLVVQRPSAPGAEALVPLRFDGTAGSAGIPVLTLSEVAADGLLADTGHRLASLRERLDAGEALGAFAIPGSSLEASVRLELERSDGVNVVGRLGVGDPEAAAVVVGAHYDHLGRAAQRGSLARADERDDIHYGADDNASGVAAMLEVARALRARVDDGSLTPRRDAIFAAWSGEELGLLGSHAFVRDVAPALRRDPMDPHAVPPPHLDATSDPGAPHDPHAASDSAGAVDPHAAIDPSAAPPHTETVAAHAPGSGGLHDRFAAYLNLDMVGRLRDSLLLQGAGSSTRWAALVEAATERAPLPVEMQNDSLLPTDASSFVTRGVPVLSGFTGAHPEYHTPRDTVDTLNYEGLDGVTRLFLEITALLLADAEAPDYIAPQRTPGVDSTHPRRAVRLRAYLGTVPDYATSAEGLALATVVAGGPAERAGLRGGDVVVELAGRVVRNVYDYTFAIEALRPGQRVAIAVRRDGQRIDLEVTPDARN